MSKPSDLFLAAYFVAYLRASSAEAKAIVWDDNYFPMSYLILFGSIRIANSRTGFTRWNLFAHDYLKKTLFALSYPRKEPKYPNSV